MPKCKTAEQQYTLTFVNQYLELQRRYYSRRFDPARQYLYSSLNRFVRPGKCVLDIGCGDGHDVKYYQSQGYEAWGIDSSEAMVNAARESVAVADRIILGDFLSLRRGTLARADAVTSRFALHYLTNLDEGYCKISDQLNFGGIFVAVFAHPFTDAIFSKKPRPGKTRLVRYPLFHGKVTVEYPAHTLEEYLSQTFFQNFELLEVDEEPEKFWVFPNCPGHLGILARKK